MKTGIYIHAGSNGAFSGVEKKIKWQLEALSQKFDVKEVILMKEPTNVVKSLCWRLPLGSWGAQYDKVIEKIEKIKCESDELSFIYLRKMPLDKNAVKFLFQIRNLTPDSKIIMEIPTYPYDKELLHNLTMWPWYFKDIIWRKRLSGCVDRIVTYSEDGEIFGIPTIRTMNGIAVDEIGPIQKTRDRTNDNKSIHMIAVAMMQPYHAYERLIKGMHSYYASGGNRELQLHMVGYGSELKMYISLTKKFGLEDKILFYGKLSGDALDEIYNRADLAIGTMGGYKIGLKKLSSIKLGEYLAKGLPVITGTRTLIFDKYVSKYNLDFPNDKSEIDINRVIEYYDELYSDNDKQQVKNEIRAFAKSTIDVSVTMKDILEYLSV